MHSLSILTGILGGRDDFVEGNREQGSLRAMPGADHRVDYEHGPLWKDWI